MLEATEVALGSRVRMNAQVDEMLAAAERGDAARVGDLLRQHPELANVTGGFGKTPLHLAAEKDHRGVAELLLAAGSRLEAETTWRMTPLEWAANMGSRGVAEALIGAGAHLHLWAAAGLGMEEEVRGFWNEAGELEAGAFKPEHRQQADGSWADDPADYDAERLISDSFYIACRNGHTAVARFLRSKGADLHFRGFWGGTPLHWAAVNGHLATVRFLVAEGARQDVVDEHFHHTPRQWAEELDQREVLAVLDGAG